MKRIWIAIGIFLAIVALCATETMYTVYVTNTTENLIQESIKLYESNNLTRATEAFDKAENLWVANRNYLDIFLAHNSVDEVSISVSAAKKYLTIGKGKDYLVECERAKEQLNNLKDEELPSFENIF